MSSNESDIGKVLNRFIEEGRKYGTCDLDECGLENIPQTFTREQIETMGPTQKRKLIALYEVINDLLGEFEWVGREGKFSWE